MKIGFCGMTHLGQTLKKASEIRGFDIAVGYVSDIDVMFVTLDVEDHEDLDELRTYMEYAVELPTHIPVVLVSQVPPGFTRPWAKKRGNIFYQVDTIIMNRALERATLPERFIVGCEDWREPPTGPYAAFLAAFNCPVMTMSYESAELSKLAINYYLAKQIEATNKLAAVARHIGGDWDQMIPGLRLDARIGAQAYIRPGEVNGHLTRDVRTIERLLKEEQDARRSDRGR
jgi:UDPglucose 6-dehydrogenase